MVKNNFYGRTHAKVKSTIQGYHEPLWLKITKQGSGSEIYESFKRIWNLPMRPMI